ncbi:MAG TPA: hypothetical protein VF875_18300 [Anaeromyxobacter sp.]
MSGEPAAEALALGRRLAALEEGAIRSHAAARHLAALEPARAVAVIGVLVRASSSAEARPALAAVAHALGGADPALPYAWLADVYAEATERGATEVTALVVSPPPQRAFEEPRDKADPRLAHLTLGHKKAFARAQRDPDLLSRLAAEGDPVVVRELLRNAQLTEPFVVRIASRRPCRPGTLRCVFESRRWRRCPAVALALVRNPFVETELALKLLGGLPTAELRDVARDGVLHPLVRAVATRIVDGRGSAGAAG